MKRCPICGKFDVEYDPSLGAERCLWLDCNWINADHSDIDSRKYEPNFTEFRKLLRPKTKMTV